MKATAERRAALIAPGAKCVDSTLPTTLPLGEGVPTLDSETARSFAERVVSSLSQEHLRAMAIELYAKMCEAAETGVYRGSKDVLENWADTADLDSQRGIARELRANLRDIAEGKGVRWVGPETRLPTR